MSSSRGRRRDRGDGPSTDARWQATVDLYELLQVSPRASRDVIQAAYRVLARGAHPDVSNTPDAPQRIRDLNAAYRILNCAEDRARYDLARARARRSHEAVSPELHMTDRIVPLPARARVVPTRPRHPEHGRDDRFRALAGPVILAVFLITIVVVVFVLVLSALLDPAPDPDSALVYPNSAVQVAGRGR
jgi:hypothetical protein